MSHYAYYEYLQVDGAELFTVVCLPEGEGQYPTLVLRSPYVDSAASADEEAIRDSLCQAHAFLMRAGYALVYQHCRGRGKSSGDCIPYIYEREDGLALLDYIRAQSFYNGEIFLMGESYTASVHFVTAPFAPDIKGAVLSVQDCERYNCNYRNGFYKMGLHGGWYFNMYKKKSGIKKAYTPDAYKMLPLSDLSCAVLGEHAEDFDAILAHPERSDPFWQTRFGGGEAHEAIRHAHIPILLVSGFYDIYTGGVFDMWRTLDEQTRAQSALIVHPFDHSGIGTNQPVIFEGGAAHEAFPDYKMRWLESIRKGTPPPVPRGKVSYFTLFDGWRCDDFYGEGTRARIPLGVGRVDYTYNPFAPASFKGGLSANFGGNAWQDEPNSRYDIISLFTPEFDEDTRIKGKMSARLTVASDCPDTCFYLRLSLCKEEGYYGLRDDITKLSNFIPDYTPGEAVTIDFSFDEIAVLLKKGERIRIDISSSAFPFYVPHTNTRGLFSEQRTAAVAHNSVWLGDSYIELPIADK